MLTKGAIGNLVNRYRAVLTKCNLINTFGSLAVASMLVLGGAGVAGAAEPVQHAGGTISSAVEIDGTAVNFKKGTTFGKGASVVGKDAEGNAVDVDATVAGDMTVGSNAAVTFGDLYVNSNLYTKANSVLTAKNISTTSLNYNNAGTINAETLTIRSFGEHSKEVINVNKLVIAGTMNFTQADNVNIKDTLEISGDYVGLGNGTETQKIKNVVLSHVQDGHTRSELQLNGTNLESENLVVSDNAWGALGSYSKGYTADVENLTVGENAVFVTWGGSSTNETLNIGTATFANNSTFMGDYDSTPSETSFDNVSIQTLIINGDTNFAAKGELVHNERNGKDYYALGVKNLSIGSIVLDEGKLTMGQDIEGLDGSLDVVVNEGGSVAFNANVKADEVNIQLNALAADAVVASNGVIDSESTTVTVPGELNNSDDVIDKVKKALVFGENTYVANIGEGDVNGAITIDSDGNATMAKNELMDAALQQASVTMVSLDKILTNDVRKRLGDIRSDKNTTGVWMRWDGGKMKGDFGLTNNFNTIQIGGDTKAAKNCRIGFAGSFTHGDTDFSRGNGELEGFSFALYGTWMGENGMFADVVARLGKFSTEMNVDGMKGDLDNRVASLSAEYGWRLPICQQFFVEPQVELAYTYVSSDDLQLGDNHYEFDNVDSLTGRAGLVAGWNLPDERGSLYARASVVQQFMGDAKISGSNGNAHNIQEIDGEDTWLEYGIGANVKLTDSTYLWADVERTEGADIEEEWRGTVGIRYSF
ncbi:autotransporter outer membrane beta-barrel domain-containing protein [Mailhella sp.]|uniref:autotransporter outer membrane beta-barrel domain-containing protein n=1 Tax=Mailhella sp. TaxID=1981029 RepID=UPI004063A2C4